MARLDLAYAAQLLRVAPTGDLVRVVTRRLRRALARRPAPLTIDRAAVAAAADALARAPRLFARDPLRELYARHFPDGLTRFERRAEAILAHEIELFGKNLNLGSKIDWQRDPLGRRRFDPHARELFPEGVDPKAAWELARAGHLVELGAAARLHPSLLPAARAEIVTQLASFLDA
jgi:hypothetical protein